MSHIIDTAKSNPVSTLILQVNLDDLKEWATELRREAVEDYQKQQADAPAYSSPASASTLPELMTVKETTEYLKVHRSTLHRWENANYLVPVRLLGSVRYRREDVLNVKGREE